MLALVITSQREVGTLLNTFIPIEIDNDLSIKCKRDIHIISIVTWRLLSEIHSQNSFLQISTKTAKLNSANVFLIS